MSEGWNAPPPPTNPPPTGPAVSAVNRPRSPQPHPGWLSRCLLWTALLIDFVPILITTPILMSGNTAMFTVMELVNIASGIISLLLGAAAMLLVRATTWARRLIAGGIFLVVGLYTLIVVPLMAATLAQAAPGPEPTMIYKIVLAAQSTVLLALTFTAWNTVRRRRWWTVFIAFAIGGLITGGISGLQALLPSSGLTGAGIYILVQTLAIVLTFAGLGVFHLLGRVPSVIVPMSASLPQFGGYAGHTPNGQAHNRWQSPP